MSRELSPVEIIDRSIVKKYRRELWAPFVTAIKMYGLIAPGDRIAVCISGGKDSMLMAKLFQLLERYTEIPFETEYLVMDPGYAPENLELIRENLARLGIKAHFRSSPIFTVTQQTGSNPCYLCARMRRGYLYRFAQDLGCNKIALGHHMNDVIETTVLAMFYASQLQGMIPKIRSRNFPGMELIRPLYRIREQDIIAFGNYHHFRFLQCACPMTREDRREDSKRKEIKELISRLKETNPDLEKSLFNSVHAVAIDTFPGWKVGTQPHSFLEKYPSSPSGIPGEDGAD